MNGLTTVERLVLESLGTTPRDVASLYADTRLELRFLANVLRSLSVRGLVRSVPEGYAVNPQLSAEEWEALNAYEARKGEAMELVSGLMGPRAARLRVRKAWMNERDRAILGAMLKNVEDFVSNMPAPPKDAPMHEWRVVVWGEDRYGAVVDRLVAEV